MATSITDKDSHGVARRRFDDSRLRLLAELRFAMPEATWAELAAQVGVTVRTTERWRLTEQWEIAVREAAQRHVSALVPDALAALKRIWKANRGEAQALAVIQGAGLLAGPSLALQHSGSVETTEEARGRFLAKIAAMAPTTSED